MLQIYKLWTDWSKKTETSSSVLDVKHTTQVGSCSAMHMHREECGLEESLDYFSKQVLH